MRHQLKKIFRHLKYKKLHLTEKPFLKLEDRPALEKGRGQLIPKNVYQTFKYPYFGKTHFNEMMRFRSLNPELSFHFFDESEQDAWMSQNWEGEIHDIYQKLHFGPARADIFRYCILFKLGGYYFDISKGCLTPLVELHDADSEGLISFEKNDVFLPPDADVFNQLMEPTKYVLQWGIAFCKEHPILKKVIENIGCDYFLYKDRIFYNPKTAILMFTGPGQFTKSVRQVLSERPELKITQAGIDFHGQGVFALRGSEARYLLSPAYADVRNAIIVN